MRHVLKVAKLRTRVQTESFAFGNHAFPGWMAGVPIGDESAVGIESRSRTAIHCEAELVPAVSRRGVGHDGAGRGSALRVECGLGLPAAESLDHLNLDFLRGQDGVQLFDFRRQ